MPMATPDVSTILFSENFTGVTPAGSYIKMPEMPFKGRIVALEINDHKDEPGAKVVKFTISCTEPGYEGAERRINKRIPDATEKGRNSRKGWRTALESVGIAPAALDGGSVLNISVGAFMGADGAGKIGHFYHVPRADDTGYDDTEFVTPRVYEQRKKALALQAAAPTAAPAGTVVSGPGAPSNGLAAAAAPAPVDAAALKNSLLL